MIKAVFFDIDGTLISYRTRLLSESAKKGIRALKKRGIKVFVATGRHIAEMTSLPTFFNEFDGYVLLNGQICLDENKKFLSGLPFTSPVREELAKIFNERQYPLALVEEKRVYINFLNRNVSRAHDLVEIPLPKPGEYSEKDLFQAIAYISPEEEAKLQPRLPKGCKFTRWNPYGADIISESAGKSVGIQVFMDKFGFSSEEIMAFGDADNDMDMLLFAGIGVAMGNARDHVKECADFVTADIDEDGIEKALLHFGLIQ